MRWSAASLFALLVCLAGCGGNGAAPFPVGNADDTAVIKATNLTCSTTYTVHRDGSAAQTGSTACGSGSQSITLPAATVSSFFAALQAAQPLSGLTPCMTVDVSMTVTWGGQQSPNLFGECGGTSQAEQTLSAQAGLVVNSFLPAP